MEVHCAPTHRLIPAVSVTEEQRDPGFVSKQRPQRWASVPIAQDLLTTSSKGVSDAPCACSREGLATGLRAVRPRGEPCVEKRTAFHTHVPRNPVLWETERSPPSSSSRPLFHHLGCATCELDKVRIHVAEKSRLCLETPLSAMTPVE